jgi:ribonuclease R
VATNEYRRFKRLLTGLERAGKIYRVKGHRYALSGSLELSPGIVSLTRAGDAFVRPDGGGGDDLFVPATHLATAMDGDHVVTRIESRPRGRSPVARVIKVLDRARETIVGAFHGSRRLDYVVPMDRRLSKDVLVPSDAGGGATDGDVVVVRLDSYGEGRVGPVGTVIEVLGSLSDPGVDVLAVARGFGLSADFPPSVMAAAMEAAERGMEAVTEEWVDRTDMLIFTIDPADAKDHDDALSVTEIGDGRFEVGVHIADVSHFVPEGGDLDVEALARGTSVYLVDRTIPMLPEALSAGVCSLKGGVERLAVSVFIELDRSGRVHGRRYERTRVRCADGLSYEQVQAVLDGGDALSPAVDQAIRTLDDLARGVRAVRMERGALDLDIAEAEVVLDERGYPVDIRRRERLESHRLIEDFMVLANEVVASDLKARDIGTLYRVHEPPSRERADELRDLLGRIGHRLPSRKALAPRDLQHLLQVVRGRPEAALVSSVVLRSLAKARYDEKNLGHFGLASSAYVHFTSPIRRYPDLVVHREVVRSLIGGEPPRAWEPGELASIGDRSSAREQAATEAERAAVALKKVEFMERHLGEEFDGTISGVAAFGFFVILERYFVDGLVHVNSLRDDFYRLREETYALVGDRGRRTYRLGDRVRVEVARVDKEARHVDFLLVRTLPAPIDIARGPNVI